MKKLIIKAALSLLASLSIITTALPAVTFADSIGDEFQDPAPGFQGCWKITSIEETEEGITYHVRRIGDVCASNQLPSIRGKAFEDLNANGKHDAGEPNMGWAYYKLTNGGSYFTCGYVGSDGTFGIPVSTGDYILMPIAPPGYRTTTPYIHTKETNPISGYTSNDMGFVKDPAAKLESCDQYNPSRSGV